MDYLQKVNEMVSKNHIGNERVAFKRRQENLETFIRTKINPLEEEILLIREKLIPLYDELQLLRDECHQHCTHPPEMLVVEPPVDGFAKAVCKFCNEVFHVDVSGTE